MIECISVIGLGHLGAPMAAVLANAGYKVSAADIDAAKVQAMRERRPPVLEPGFEELLRSASTRLTATSDVAEAVRDSDLSFIVVPTPSGKDGSFGLQYVLEVCSVAGGAIREKPTGHVFVITSTVMPGSTGGAIRRKLENESGKLMGQGFGLCYSPQFIALGSVIRNLLHPDFNLIGESDPRSGDILAELYRSVCEGSPPAVRMNFVNAELTKLAVNTYVTTKISFANMLARICEHVPEADVDVVTSALGSDTRIGPKFLRGAIGYGGPCFPRDNAALASAARSVGAEALLAEATDRFNRDQASWLAELVKAYVPPSGTVGVLGLAYKPDTDVVEESHGLYLVNALAADAISVIAYDPLARVDSVRITESAAECVDQSDVVVITTPLDEYRHLDWSTISSAERPRTVVDCWRHYPELDNVEGILYVPLGIGPIESEHGEQSLSLTESSVDRAVS